MSREYYIYRYRLNKDNYLIWFSNEVDGFVTDENGFVPSFMNLNDLQEFAGKKNLKVDDKDPNLLVLDLLVDWLDKIEKIEDYNPFLDAWNLFEDISISINGDFDKYKKVTNGLYERIFWGCNISAVTPEGESFTPTWTTKELKTIHKTLSNGFQMFNEKVKQY